MEYLRDQFLLDPTIHFLNHGTFGATPKPVFAEYQRWQAELERRPVEFLGRRAPGLLAESRAALGKYLGTSGDNLVYTQNVTIALNVIAHSLALGAGDEVLASDHEYGAMDRMWRHLAERRGFEYKIQAVALTSRQDFIESFWQAVTPRTRVIFLSHITSPTAIIFPVEEIIKRAKAAGIMTVIDGAHVAGQLPLDLDALGVDFYGGNLHKWLCAPKGAGYLYASPRVQDMIEPLVISWGSESDEASGSAFVDNNQWWGTRDVAAFLAVPAAIEFQAAHDWDEVRRECHTIVHEAQMRICEQTGIAPLHSESDEWFRQMATAPLPAGIDALLLKKNLYDEFHIEIPITTWKDRRLIRISIQGYNSRADVDALLLALSQLL